MFYASPFDVTTLSPEQEQLLHQQTIDETNPGTILRDFQTLLDFIGAKGIEVSSTNHFLPLKSLSELNARLNHPIQIGLKRPQQKSYPNITGLYLLLRASGLSSIETKGKKYILVLDSTALQSWNSLNPTERYFNLLETWLIWGSEEILGERGAMGSFGRCLAFWRRIPDKGLKLGKLSDEYGLTYYPGLHNIALLEMFGCLSVESAKPEKGKGWKIKRLERSHWGDALLLFLYGLVDSEFEQEDEGKFEGFLGQWQSAFQPFFPEWQNNLTIPEPEFRDGLYVFKVSLKMERYARNTIWRRIAIPAKLTFEHLSSIILKSVNFDNDHLYCFSYKNHFGWTVQINHPYLEEPPFTTEICIGDLGLKEGKSITYVFDFGDNWEFNVQLERIEPANPKIKNPKILETYGESPEQYPAWDEEYWEEE
ncbi:MAG: plasmid pRiA4b ORF-3 family protein [Coleofasciculus sp. S288]|nr:plasmid pRiA4b ORF-3 family protein [Coleofasciculus sp. S288]